MDKQWIIKILNEEINLINQQIEQSVNHQNLVGKLSGQKVREILLRLMKKIQDASTD